MQEDAAWALAGDRGKGAKAPVAWADQWKLVPLDSAFVLTVGNRCSIFQASHVSNAHARRVAPLWQGNNSRKERNHAKRR